jgi:hypothetical protein
MRGGTHCRPHRDPELGPRGAGAPAGNLNALRTGDHAHPLSPADLDQLVHDILRAPDQLPRLLDHTIRDIHRRCQDPARTLLALQALLSTLASRVADDLFVAELHAYARQLPPARRSHFELTIWPAALQLIPARKLDLIRSLRNRRQPQEADAPQSSQRQNE